MYHIKGEVIKSSDTSKQAHINSVPLCTQLARYFGHYKRMLQKKTVTDDQIPKTLLYSG